MIFDVLTGVLVLSNVALAASVFILLARPDAGVAFLLRRSGLREGWFEEHLEEEELARLRLGVRLAGYIGLALVFAWSVLAGSLMTLSQLLAT